MSRTTRKHLPPRKLKSWHSNAKSQPLKKSSAQQRRALRVQLHNER